jgi:hypothetical protein
MLGIRRLHWGCNTITPAGWINSDIKEGSGICPFPTNATSEARA